MEDLTNFWGHKIDSKEMLIEKGKQFQRASSNNLIQIANIENLVREEKRLIDLQQNIDLLVKSLSLDEPKPFAPLVARVSRRALPSWWQTIGLRRGTKDGVKKGIGVISHNGVVGRVSNPHSE